MKLIKQIILILAVSALTACNMDSEIYSEPKVDGYAKDAKGVNSLLIGAYGSMHAVMYNEWALTELRSDNTRMRVSNSTSADTKLIEQLDQCTVLSAHSWVGEYWTASYHVIACANNVLANLPVVDDEQLHKQYEGEARFLRALNYFNLVRLWGPVFKVTKKLTVAESRRMQRSPSEDIYALIEEDLTAIVDGNLLPAKFSGSDAGRATLTAAKALLAKVYITRYAVGSELYVAGKGLLKEVITSLGDPQSGNALVPYDKIFAISNEMNDEVVFAVRYLSGYKGLGSPFGGLFGPNNNGGNVIMGSPKQYNYPTDELVALFAKNAADKRIPVSYATRYFNKTTGKYVVTSYVTKYLSPVITEYDGENDWPVIRLGDLLLLYAEVSAELEGVTSEAVKYLNMTRERAGVPVYSTADFGSMTQFRTALREERRLELAFENHRWFDLVRWGIADATVTKHLIGGETFYNEYGYIQPVESWQTMLPIPLSVININPDVAQNVGY